MFRFNKKYCLAAAPFVHFIITITMHGGNPPISGRFVRSGYASDSAYYDQALSEYIQNLPEGCTVFIYGDHQSYSGPNRDGTVPFLIYQNNRDLSELQTKIAGQTVFSRCEISLYLRKLFSEIKP